MTDTIKVIKEILSKLRASPSMKAELSDTADLLNDVCLDSLELLQFMLEVEAKMLIRIDFEKLDYLYLSSISTLANFLDSMPARQTQTNLP
jgi:acyl carrier protein